MCCIACSLARTPSCTARKRSRLASGLRMLGFKRCSNSFNGAHHECANYYMQQNMWSLHGTLLKHSAGYLTPTPRHKLYDFATNLSALAEHKPRKHNKLCKIQNVVITRWRWNSYPAISTNICRSIYSNNEVQAHRIQQHISVLNCTRFGYEGRGDGAERNHWSLQGHVHVIVFGS